MRYIGIALFLLVGCSEPPTEPVAEKKVDFREQWKGEKWTGETLMMPGLPAVPKVLITLPLPDGEEVGDVLFVEDGAKESRPSVPMTFPDTPVQRPLCGGKASPVVPKRDFEPDEVFPKEQISKPITVTKEGRRYAQVTLYPVRYYPASKRAVVSKGGVLTVKTRKAKRPAHKPSKRPPAKPLEEFIETVGHLPEGVGPRHQKIDYLVIGPYDLVDHGSDLPTLLQEKQSRGLSTGVLTTEEISSSYYGDDLQEQNRNAISDYYQQYGVRWVLLVGDGFSVTPTRVMYLGENAIPSDLYFGCLDGQLGPDEEVDMACEVAVGRAPVQSAAEMRVFVEKTLALSAITADDPRVWDTLNLGEKMDDETLGSPLLEQLPYPEHARFGKLYDDFSTAFDANDVLNYMGQHQFYTVNHIGHFNQGYGMRVSSDQIPYIQTSAPFFGFTQGCLSGDLSGPNWASQMVLNGNGGAVRWWRTPATAGTRREADMKARLSSYTAPSMRSSSRKRS